MGDWYATWEVVAQLRRTIADQATRIEALESRLRHIVYLYGDGDPDMDGLDALTAAELAKDILDG